jgi:4-amino-4-deoxy-L-arabinose transferase-like glycosyltransferase
MFKPVRAISLVTPRWWLTVGLGLVFALRMLFVCSLPNKIDYWRDGLSYDDIARNLVSGVGYWDMSDSSREWYGEPPYANPSAPTARWLPGYPLFIAAVYLVFGETYRAVYIAQAFLGVAIAGFIYLLTTSTLGKRVGVVAIFLYAMDFFSIAICGRFQTEQLFTLILIASLYCFVKMREHGRSIKFAILTGLLAGVGALTRSVAGLVFAGLCLGILLGWEEGFRQSRFRTRILVVTIASVVFLGILAPWLVRNHKLTGHYVLSTETWETLAMANNDSGGAYFTLAELAAMPQTFIKQPEIERETIYKSFVIKWITTHPTQFARFYLKRAIVFWSPSLHEAKGPRAWLGLAFNLFLLLCAAIYAISHRKDWRKIVSIYITLLTFTLGYSLAFVTTRFRLPLYPLLEILAAGGLLFVVDQYLPTGRLRRGCPQ